MNIQLTAGCYILSRADEQADESAEEPEVCDRNSGRNLIMADRLLPARYHLDRQTVHDTLCANLLRLTAD